MLGFSCSTSPSEPKGVVRAKLLRYEASVWFLWGINKVTVWALRALSLGLTAPSSLVRSFPHCVSVSLRSLEAQHHFLPWQCLSPLKILAVSIQGEIKSSLFEKKDKKITSNTLILLPELLGRFLSLMCGSTMMQCSCPSLEWTWDQRPSQVNKTVPEPRHNPAIILNISTTSILLVSTSTPPRAPGTTVFQQAAQLYPPIWRTQHWNNHSLFHQVQRQKSSSEGTVCYSDLWNISYITVCIHTIQDVLQDSCLKFYIWAACTISFMS